MDRSQETGKRKGDGVGRVEVQGDGDGQESKSWKGELLRDGSQFWVIEPRPGGLLL